MRYYVLMLTCAHFAWAQFIFMGPTPLEVMDQFTLVVGRPALMPHWTLGFHQCK